MKIKDIIALTIKEAQLVQIINRETDNVIFFGRVSGLELFHKDLCERDVKLIYTDIAADTLADHIVIHV